MKLRLCLLLPLLATVVGGGLWNWRQQREVARLRAQVESTRAVVNGTRRQPVELGNAIQSILPTSVASPPETSAAATSTAGRETVVVTPAPAAEAREEAAPDPVVVAELHKLALLNAHVAVERDYQPFFLLLAENRGRDPELVERVKALLLQREQLISDPEGGPAGLAAAIAAHNAQIQQALGASAYALFRDYQRTRSERETVKVVTQLLDSGSPPLTFAQTEQLVSVLARFRVPRGLVPGKIPEEAIAAATNILYPAQLTALRQAQAYYQSSNEVHAWLYRLQRPSD